MLHSFATAVRASVRYRGELGARVGWLRVVVNRSRPGARAGQGLRSTCWGSAFGVVVLAAGAIVSGASASQLIDRNASAVRLQVDAKGEAMLTYTVEGRVKHVLAWGAVNARPPARGGKQVAFELDYSGGFGKYHARDYWQTADWVCLPYDGPPLAWQVAACKGLDGSYWALQEWPQARPDLGYTPWTPAQDANWLERSHWTSNTVAKLTA